MQLVQAVLSHQTTVVLNRKINVQTTMNVRQKSDVVNKPFADLLKFVDKWVSAWMRNVIWHCILLHRSYRIALYCIASHLINYIKKLENRTCCCVLMVFSQTN